MKKSELKRLVAEYRNLKLRSERNAKNHHVMDKLKEIEHRYFHETGQKLNL